MSGNPSFVERGGVWVLAQIPVLVVASVLAPWTSRAPAAFAYPLRYLGALLVLAGIGVVAAGFAALGASLTPFPRPRHDSILVTRGIYRFIRHPVYSGLIIGTLGWALVWWSPVGALYAGFVGVFFDRKATREERWLRERYPGYAVYARRVRRFLPGVY